jgi:hypothetical protein
MSFAPPLHEVVSLVGELYPVDVPLDVSRTFSGVSAWKGDILCENS